MFGRQKIATIVAEALGTAVLTLSVLTIGKSQVGLSYFIALGAAITLGMIVLLFASVSGAHVNPAVTLAHWTLRKISTTEAIVYVAAQFLGAAVSWRLYVYFIDQALPKIAGKFDWRVLIAEAVGTFIFSFGIAAAVYQGYEGGKLAATVAASFFVGIVVAGTVSHGLLNPAVALGVQSWERAYVVGPVVGAVVGMNLYALLFVGPQAIALPSRKAKVAVKRTATRRKK